jgi:hypothetical protein
MGRNGLKQAFEKDGITAASFVRCCSVSKSTIKKLLTQRRAVSPSTQHRIVESINRIADSTYSVKDLFPGCAPRSRKATVRNDMPSKAVTKKESITDLADTARRAATAFKDAAKKGVRSS